MPGECESATTKQLSTIYVHKKNEIQQSNYSRESSHQKRRDWVREDDFLQASLPVSLLKDEQEREGIGALVDRSHYQ